MGSFAPTKPNGGRVAKGSAWATQSKKNTLWTAVYLVGLERRVVSREI